MKLSRRTFLKGLAATAAGVLIPGDVLAEPERRIWALDSTMLGDQDFEREVNRRAMAFKRQLEEATIRPGELIWVESLESDHLIVRRGMGGTNPELAGKQAMIKLEHETRISRYDFLQVTDEGIAPLGVNGPNVSLGEDISLELMKRMP